MRASPAAILEAWECDWALGELLHLISDGKRRGIMAHELDPALFSACMRVIGSQAFVVRQELHRIIVSTEYWRVFHYERIGGRLYKVRGAYF
jgi:hypothetical protein